MSVEKSKAIEDSLVLSVDTRAEFVFNTEEITQDHLNIKRVMNKELEDYLPTINNLVKSMIIQFMYTRRKAFNEGISYINNATTNKE